MGGQIPSTAANGTFLTDCQAPLRRKIILKAAARPYIRDKRGGRIPGRFRG